MYLGSGVVEVFDPGLGTLQGYEAKIQVMPILSPGSIKPDPHHIQ